MSRAVRVGLYCLIPAVLLGVSDVASPDGDGACSSDWYVTGYFTASEADYHGPRVPIRAEDGRTTLLKSDFVETVKTEGWGKTETNEYIGYNDGLWQQSSRPLSAKGDPLRVGSVATDPAVIPSGGIVIIPTLREFSAMRFTADDVGTAIKGRHIDIYTGEGAQAERLAEQITGGGHTVCQLNQ